MLYFIVSSSNLYICKTVFQHHTLVGTVGNYNINENETHVEPQTFRARARPQGNLQKRPEWHMNNDEDEI